MSSTTLRVARKTRICDKSWMTEHDITAGELYARHVAFPGDEGWEEGARPAVLSVCAPCEDERGLAVRAQYGVPARFGGRVTVYGKPGTIGGFEAARLLVRLDGESGLVRAHPTDQVVYDDALVVAS